MFQTKVVQKVKTQNLCSVTFPPPPPAQKIVPFVIQCEKNSLEKKIWHMRTARWITKAKSTHSEYVILTAFPRPQWFHERVPVARYTYIACLT